MRLIDTDEVIFELNRMLNIVDERNARPDQEEEFKTIRTYVEWTKEVIHDTPTVDAVEVVRCKDCKFGVYEKGRGIYHIRCEILEFLFQDDDYCSYGERKDESEVKE